jgi:hypothetical protein
MDRRDPQGKRLADKDGKGLQERSPNRSTEPFKKKKKSLKELLQDWDQSSEEEVLSPKRDEDLEYRRAQGEHKDDQEEEDGNTSLMAQEIDKEEEEAPLHDLMYVGIDTCSARSISCQKEDFLDLKLIDEEDRDDQLRGVGGKKGVAGKGCLVFYAKDIDGKIKAIIEPKGFYLENPPAKFRILGQQRMKTKGLCAIQDYDDQGTDILKCKRVELSYLLRELEGFFC